jgi:hypothetical protein
MSDHKGLGFGGFLVGLGAGWMVFQEIHVSGDLFAWIMIIAGTGVVASSLLFSSRGNRHFGGLIRGLTVGTVLSLMITSNFVLYGISSGGYSGSYRAQDTVTFTGALTADSVLLDINSFNGPIEVSTWEKDEYSISALIKAKGTTDAEAEENLERFEFDLDEGMILGKKRLVLRHNVAGTMKSRYSVQVEVWLPADATIDLDLDSSNGGMYLSDIDGGEINLDTSNGGMRFDDVEARNVDASTSNGPVTGSLDASDADIGTSNGAITLTLPCTRNGRYELRTSNGPVQLEVSSSMSVGYELDLTTSNGIVDIDLPNLDYIVSTRTRKEAHTYGLASKSVRIAIDASTSNGSMRVDS